MPRQFRMVAHRISTYGQTITLEDSEIARVVAVELRPESNGYLSPEWNVLVAVGPAETVDEMAKAMERTLRSAP